MLNSECVCGGGGGCEVDIVLFCGLYRYYTMDERELESRIGYWRGANTGVDGKKRLEKEKTKGSIYRRKP